MVMIQSTTTRYRRDSSWITTAVYTVAVGVGVPLVASWVTPLTLGALTTLRQRIYRNGENTDDSDDDNNNKTTLLTGRVWHTRFHPVRHAFTYPLFMFGVDLDDTDDERLNDKLWPLSLIMKFSTKHHLINGEGGSGNKNDGNGDERPLRERIYTLIHERTSGYLKPTRATHTVWLVTHLEYYGYCFNPVSFYYLFHRETGRMQAIVAEVSNTPWIEMYPYVLHPTSSDKVRYFRTAASNGKDDDGGEEGRAAITNFKFPKNFHVSPFMEMSYTYDWDFSGEDKVYGGDQQQTLYVKTAMRRRQHQQQEQQPDGDDLQFSGTMRLQAAGLDPFMLAWQLARYPSYCLIVQLWIHYEAFWLFVKGVAYQPHPQGAETAASRIIGAAMAPLFELQAWWDGQRRPDQVKTVD
uniref:Uncharacterized protein n=1 Tax=Amphora coffeiformis TaxID=265554 RepID=A0A7S3P491_9STRA